MSATDDQNLTLAGNTLSIEDGNNVDLSGYLDNTDDQNLTGATLTGNTLQIDIENGTSASVDLSALDNSGTDDQALSLAGNTLTLEDGGSVDLSGYVSTDDQALSLAGNTLTLEDGGSVDLSGYVSTDDQNLTLAGNTLSIEDGNNVDLSGYLDNTDDQNLTGATLTGNTLQIDIENGTSASVDLSSLDNSGTDDQALSLAGNTLTLEDGGSVDLSGYVSTDDQNIQNLGLAGTTLTVGIESGTSQTVDLASLVGTDDQALSLAGNTLTLEDGGSVDLSGYVSTDDQNLTLAGNTLSIEDGNNVDLSGYLDNTDDQNLTGATLTGNTLQIDIENGTSASVDLSALDNSGTDDQALSLAGNTLTLEDGGSVDLSGYVSTDDQNLTGATLTGNTLQINIENGTSASVDLSALDNSGTDDQALSLAGNTLTLEDGGSVDLSGYVSTDDQNIQNLGLAGTTLTVGIESGTSQTVDLASLVGTDDQALSLAGNTLTLEDGGSVDLSGYVSTDDQVISTTGAAGNITIESGNTLNLNVNDADADPTNERNTAFAVNGANLDITDSGGTLSVPIASLGTDTQDLSIDGTGKIISLVDGGSVTINADDADANATNEIQALSRTGTNVTLSAWR